MDFLTCLPSPHEFAHPSSAKMSTLKRLGKLATTRSSKSAGAPAADRPVDSSTALALTDRTAAAPAAAVSTANAALQAELDALRAENASLKTEKAQMQEEKETLASKAHLLQFKVELLLDMVTLANLDCDKLEDELEAATGAPLPEDGRKH